MTTVRGPILKRARSLGLQPSEIGVYKESHRNPSTGKKKESEYAKQLKEKQKLKFIYGLREKQFYLYYEKASKMRGITGDNMLIMLERRLDNVIFRLGFAKTRAMARQEVNHAQFTVNGKVVNLPSYLVSAGDVIAVRENKKKKGNFANVNDIKAIVPKWLEADIENLSGKVTRLPVKDDITLPVEERLIVELYSK